MSAVADAEFSGVAYAGHTAHHRAHDAGVLAAVPWRRGMRVLDLGCGVGDLTRRIGDLVGAGHGAGDGDVLGVDSSHSQIETARSQASRPGVRFEVVRAQELSTAVPADSADVVLSVATLHWILAAEQPEVLAGVVSVLRPGGLLRVDMGGAGQIEDTRLVLDEVAELHEVDTAPWFFPTAEQFTDLLLAAGLTPMRVQLLRQERPMPDEAALDGWLRSQVLPGYLRGMDPSSPRAAAFCSAAVERCAVVGRRGDGGFAQHYVRLDALAQLP